MSECRSVSAMDGPGAPSRSHTAELCLPWSSRLSEENEDGRRTRGLFKARRIRHVQRMVDVARSRATYTDYGTIANDSSVKCESGADRGGRVTSSAGSCPAAGDHGVEHV